MSNTTLSTDRGKLRKWIVNASITTNDWVIGRWHFRVDCENASHCIGMLLSSVFFSVILFYEQVHVRIFTLYIRLEISHIQDPKCSDLPVNNYSHRRFRVSKSLGLVRIRLLVTMVMSPHLELS